MIREAGPADAPLVAALEAAAASHPWSAASVAAILALPTTRAWLAGDPPEGYVVASFLGDQGEILTLGVAPAARRRGLGRALVARCAAAWREAGVARGFLEVRADNAAAIALYRRAGWEPAGRRAGYYADGVDALVLSLAP